MKKKTSDSFYVDLGVIDCETFNNLYPFVNEYLLSDDCGSWEPSRDGNVKEMLDVKTHITNPYRRCVGGYGRNIHIFFLLAEAMWIALGHKDVDWLVLFNKQMAKYSDDGKSFHAPYGYRLRHWGNRSEDSFVGENFQAAFVYGKPQYASGGYVYLESFVRFRIQNQGHPVQRYCDDEDSRRSVDYNHCQSFQ